MGPRVKIYVVGNCQAEVLADCLTVMCPRVRVEYFPFARDPGAVAADDDVIFRQSRVMAVPEPRRSGVTFPRIWFNAFHPDMVTLPGPTGSVEPPLGNAHSTLVLYAWRHGLSTAKTLRLFSEPVYERLHFFRYWEPAKRALLEEGERVRYPLDASLARWEACGPFMHTTNHPALFVAADIARTLASRANLSVAVSDPERLLHDRFKSLAVWPIYPEIASRFGLRGAYAFKMAQPPQLHAPPICLDLEEFIERSFEAYAHMSPSALACARLDSPLYRDLESVEVSTRNTALETANATAAPRDPQGRGASPYADLPPSRFWRRAIEMIPAADVDPVGDAPFPIGRGTRIATAGSCFAQHISSALARHGYNYFVAERPPEDLSADQARLAGYGVFSTRCGNIYTARQLLQLFDRAYGTFAPGDSVWIRADGRYVDPFRPQIEPHGFATLEELISSRERHLAAVRAMFEGLDVLVFTLGLTEAWRSKDDGAVFPLAPGVLAGRMDPARYEFCNFTVDEVTDDLHVFLARLERVNPDANLVLTVSPVPLIATYEPRHVLVSTTCSKAVLRASADEIERSHPQVWYFPAYEIVCGTQARGAYFERDLRSVSAAGVNHVMRLFLAHCAPGDEPRSGFDAAVLEENRRNFDVLCDEEVIADDGFTVPISRDADPRGSREWHEYLEVLDRERFARSTSGVPVDHVAPPTAMEPLDASSMRAPLEVTLPRGMTARAVVTVSCTIANAGDTTLVSAEKHGVFLCYRWYGEAGDLTEVGRSLHTPLTDPLEPAASTTLSMRIAAPGHAGRYRLRVALLQSEVAWFDDVDPTNGVDVVVDVSSRAAPAMV